MCFPANDPGPDGDFGAANAAVLEAARRADGRIVPFCRIDPLRRGAARAMDRAAAGGAVGLKLHPVAQRFRPEHPDAAAAVREATARGWPVTIHAGYGARPLARPIAALLDAAPGARLILAHGGRGDARALARLAAGRPGVLLDTSLAALRRPGRPAAGAAGASARTGPTASTAPRCAWWRGPRRSPAGAARSSAGCWAAT